MAKQVNPIMKKTALDPPIKFLLQIIDEAYDKKAWHGPNLRGSLREVTAKEAAWKPAPGRHNIREIVLHAAYWKYIVRRRLSGDKRGSFPLKGSNWFDRPIPLTEKAWRLDVALLQQEHLKMRGAVAALPHAALNETAPGSKVSNLTLIGGIAYHDLYHAGQIQLLKRLQKRIQNRPGPRNCQTRLATQTKTRTVSRFLLGSYWKQGPGRRE